MKFVRAAPYAHKDSTNLITLTLLRGRDKEFNITTKVDYGYKFDDLTINYNEKDTQHFIFSKTIFLSTSNTKVITSNVLKGKQKNFSKFPNEFKLKNYFRSYLRVTDQFNQNEDQQLELDSLVFYTNVFKHDPQIFEECKIENSYLQLLPTGVKPIYRKLRKDSEVVKKLLDIENDFDPDLDLLADWLCEQLKNVESKNVEKCEKIKDNHEILSYYHHALITEKVLEKTDSKELKFHTEFINEPNSLSDAAKNLREKMLNGKKEDDFKEQLEKFHRKVTNVFNRKTNVKKLPNYKVSTEEINNFCEKLVFFLGQSNGRDLPDAVKKQLNMSGYLEDYVGLIQIKCQESIEKWRKEADFNKPFDNKRKNDLFDQLRPYEELRNMSSYYKKLVLQNLFFRQPKMKFDINFKCDTFYFDIALKFEKEHTQRLIYYKICYILENSLEFENLGCNKLLLYYYRLINELGCETLLQNIVVYTNVPANEKWKPDKYWLGDSGQIAYRIYPKPEDFGVPNDEQLLVISLQKVIENIPFIDEEKECLNHYFSALIKNNILEEGKPVKFSLNFIENNLKDGPAKKLRLKLDDLKSEMKNDIKFPEFDVPGKYNEKITKLPIHQFKEEDVEKFFDEVLMVKTEDEEKLLQQIKKQLQENEIIPFQNPEEDNSIFYGVIKNKMEDVLNFVQDKWFDNDKCTLKITELKEMRSCIKLQEIDNKLTKKMKCILDKYKISFPKKSFKVATFVKSKKTRYIISTECCFLTALKFYKPARKAEEYIYVTGEDLKQNLPDINIALKHFSESILVVIDYNEEIQIDAKKVILITKLINEIKPTDQLETDKFTKEVLKVYLEKKVHILNYKDELLRQDSIGGQENDLELHSKNQILSLDQLDVDHEFFKCDDFTVFNLIDFMSKEKSYIGTAFVPINNNSEYIPREFRKEDSNSGVIVSEDDIFENSSHKVCIISADSGMGKTSFLNNLAKRAYCNKLDNLSDKQVYVCKLNLDDDIITETDVEQTSLDFLLDTLMKVKDIERYILRKLFEVGNVVLVVDDYQDTHIDIINKLSNIPKGISKIFIATTEKKLDILEADKFFLQPFSDTYINGLMLSISEAHNFLMIPSQLNLVKNMLSKVKVCEGFEKRISLTQLFEKYTQSFLTQQEAGINYALSKFNLQFLLEENKNDVNFRKSVLEEFDKHPSFAEYFLARFLYERFFKEEKPQQGEFLFDRVLCNKKYKNVRIFLNDILDNEKDQSKEDKINSLCKHYGNILNSILSRKTFAMNNSRIILCTAVEENLLQIVKFLLKCAKTGCKAILEATTIRDGLTPFDLAIQKKNEDMIEVFEEAFRSKSIKINGKSIYLLSGKSELFKKFVTKDNIDSVGENGCTALHFALEDKNASVEDVKNILSMEPDFKKRNIFGETALDVALRHGKEEHINLFLTHKSTEDGSQPDGRVEVSSPTERARNRWRKIQLRLPLIKWIAGKPRISSLHSACMGGNLDFVKKLLSKNNNELMIRNSDNMKPIHVAIRYGHKDVVKYLLEQYGGETKKVLFQEFREYIQLNPNEKINLENRAIEYIIDTLGIDNKDMKGRRYFVELLSSNGQKELVSNVLRKMHANIMDQINFVITENCPTTLNLMFDDWLETIANNYKLIDDLKCNGSKEMLKRIIYFLAPEGINENTSILDLLLGKLDKKRLYELVIDLKKDKDTLMKDKIEFFTFLVTNLNMNLWQKDQRKNTVLHMAILEENRDIVNIILKKAEYNDDIINEENQYGITPLILALMQYLQTPDKKSDCKSKEIVKDLINVVQNINSLNKDRYQNSVLHLAVATGDKEIVELLLSKGHQCDDKNSEGNTPLHLAVEYEYEEIVGSLLKSNGQHDIKNNQRRTPKQLAKKDSNIIKLFDKIDQQNMKK